MPTRAIAIAGLACALATRLLFAGAMRERVVFDDPRYDHHWVDEPAKVVDFFVARGFERKDAAPTARVRANGYPRR